MADILTTVLMTVTMTFGQKLSFVVSFFESNQELDTICIEKSICTNMCIKLKA